MPNRGANGADYDWNLPKIQLDCRLAMSMTTIPLKEFSWERMIAAVEDVRERACRAAKALGRAGIPYMIVDGNAVAAWVARVGREGFFT
jgi:hypothetical protein